MQPSILSTMMLFVDGISRGIHCTNVAYWVQDYEQAFDLLTELTADEWSLQRAIVVDGNERLSLPTEAFDGQPIHIHIKALQGQWMQLLLAKPLLSSTLDKQEFNSWCLQLDVYYGDLLTHLGKMICLLETRKRTAITKRNEQVRIRLDKQYCLLIDINKRMYEQTKKHRDNNRQRLTSWGQDLPD